MTTARILGSNGLLLSSSQEYKEQVANELFRLVSVARAPIVSRIVTTPPTNGLSPDSFYIVPAGASGAWSGKTDKIACPAIGLSGQVISGAWKFYDPFEGLKVSLLSGGDLVYSGNEWAAAPGGGDMLADDYDSDGDLKVDAAEVADEIAGTPSGDNVYGVKDGVKGWTGFSAWVRSVPLFGLVTGANTAITNSNTIIQAFQNLQAQITAILTGGRLIPPGGTTGQVLKKSTNGDYAVGWGDDNAGTSGSSAFTGLADTFSSFTGRASQFLRVNAAGTLIESIALGAAAFLKPGTDPGDLLQRDVDGRYPAGDGRNITAINAGNITTGTLSTARLDTGTTAGKVVVLDGAGKLPAVDGSQLTNLPSGGGSAITVSDEGTNLTSNATSFNFTGSGVTATNSGGAVTVNVSGGGSSLTTSVITANTTAVSNTRYLCNTSSGSFTLTLPASPNNSDVIEIADFNNSSLLTGFGINPLTITANTGHNIVGNTNLVLDRGGQGVELVFHTNRWSIVSGIGENSTLVLLQNQLLAEVQAVMLAGGF
jgi:hypothetical protein